MGASFLPVSVFASESTNSVMPGTPGAANAEERAARCEAFQARSADRLASMDERQQENLERINAGTSKLNSFVEKATEMGSDTASLEASIDSLEALVSELVADNDALRSHAASVATVDCTTVTLEEWQGLMATGKSLFEALRDDVKHIQDLNKTIKEQITAILAAVEANAAPSETQE